MMSLLYSSETSASFNTLCNNSTSTTYCTSCIVRNLSDVQFSISVEDYLPVSEDPRIETLRRYSYGIALPAICFLGIVGNIFNLIVLTRKNMRGTAYIYMREKCSARELLRDRCVYLFALPTFLQNLPAHCRTVPCIDVHTVHTLINLNGVLIEYGN